MLKFFDTVLIVCIVVVIAAFLYMRNRVVCSPDVKPYVDIFFAEAKSHNVKLQTFYLLKIKFSDKLKKPIAGVSWDSYSDRYKLISIDRLTWNSISHEQRTQLIAHELGHAILHRAHTTEKMLDGSPYSIMHPVMLDPQEFSRNYNHYWAELFSKQGDL